MTQAPGTFKWAGPLCPRYVLERAAALLVPAADAGTRCREKAEIQATLPAAQGGGRRGGGPYTG